MTERSDAADEVAAAAVIAAPETVNLAGLAALRAPFPAEVIGKKPAMVDKASTSRHCNVCGKYHKQAGLHLDYLGHATVTGRLLDVDPCWDWEPMAYDAQGSPAVIKDGDGNYRAMWIKLTVCGVTRKGVGTVEASKGPDALKELVGDAIRNAAMRFGVGLDLWGAIEHEPDTEDRDVGDYSQQEYRQTAGEQASVAQDGTAQPAGTSDAGTPPADDRAALMAKVAKIIPTLAGEKVKAFQRYRREAQLPTDLNTLEVDALRELLAVLERIDRGEPLSS